MKNRTLLHPEARAEILRRIEALTPESERRWGRKVVEGGGYGSLNGDGQDTQRRGEGK